VPGSLVGGVWLQREEAVDAGGSAPSLRIVNHRRDAAAQDVAMSKVSSTLGRRAWALSVHRLLAAERHRFPAWWQDLHPCSAFPPRIRRQLVRACRPTLLAIAGLLVDQRQLISAVALWELRRFLTKPVDSPPVREEPDRARRSAPALQRLRRPPRTVIGLAGLMPWTGCSAIAVVVFCWSGIHLDHSTATGNGSGDPVRIPPRSLSAEHDGSR
jgi:hypothetical protein